MGKARKNLVALVLPPVDAPQPKPPTRQEFPKPGKPGATAARVASPFPPPKGKGPSKGGPKPPPTKVPPLKPPKGGEGY